MICGHIDNTEAIHYPSAVARAIAWLASQDLKGMEAGRYKDSETGWLVQVLDLQTAPVQENYPEAHRHHIDVQYLVAGSELIGVASQPVNAAVHQPYDENRDIIFYQQVPDETWIRMVPGSFAVFFPQDIHRPNCAPDFPAAIRKVVVKIPTADLVN
ncbi:YhcH/YjgK/YiaL family protein [Erwinia mallotivora]|uniref:YhcH/YjgK/YiaL family protein n=1 Tax=Erwinia mallotivora TaxID=69222 RepID=UPI0021BEBC2D|nr:YhcH/YjgK/YiaL family protein [Erwinia mallotivora]